MEKEEYQRLYDFENFYWWHIGRRYIIKSLISQIFPKKNSQILDVGCGCGGNFNTLSQFGKVIGLDESPEAIKFCQKRGFKDLILGKAENINFPEEYFDLVVALDLFEHIDDEKKVLEEFYRVLKKDGYILITVPAYQFLWSEHDEALGHKRRYTLSTQRDLIKRAGFNIVKESYFITFTFPFIFGYRIYKKIFGKNKKGYNKSDYVILPSFLNNFLIFSLKLEAFLVRYLTFPFGVSITCLAQKPENIKKLSGISE